MTIPGDLRFNPSGTVLAMERDGVELWDLRTRERLFKRAQDPIAIRPPVAVSADGRYAVYTLSPKDGVQLVDTRSGKSRPLPGKENEGYAESGQYAADFSPDGHLLAATDGSTVGITDVKSGKAVGQRRSAFGLTEVKFSGDGRFVAGLTSNGQIRMWTVEGFEVMRHQVQGKAESLGFGAGDRSLRVLTDQSTVLTLDVSGFPHPSPVRPGSSISGPLSRDGGLAVGWSHRDGTWELGVTDVRLRAQLPGIRMTIKSPWNRGNPVTAFSSDGSRLAVAVNDPPSVAIWDVPARRLLGSLPVNELREIPVGAWGLALSPDGRTLATSAYDVTRTQLWDVATMRRTRTLREAGGSALTFSPDGNRLWVYGTFYKVVDLRTGEATV